MIVVTNPSTVEAESYPLTHARIGWHRYDGSVSASSAAAGFPASAAKSMNTYEFWKPDTIPAWWKIDLGSAKPVDYCGIAVHDWVSNDVTIQYSVNNSDWTSINSAADIPDSAPLLFLFPTVTARYWRVYAEGSRIGVVAHIRFGKIMPMMRPFFAGHTPVTLSRQTVIQPNVSERGQFLGRSAIRSGVQTSAEWSHLDPNWYRANFDPFVQAARTDTFFFAWRPAPGSPSENDVAYCWTNDDIAPSNMGIRNLMQVGFSMSGVANYE